MGRKWILTLLLHCECLTITIASPEAYSIPSSGVFLSYLLANKFSTTPLLGGIAQEDRHFQCSDVEDRKDSGRGSLCLWNGTDTSYTTHKQYLELKKSILAAIPSDVHLVDYTWSLQCWAGENIGRITCRIQYVAQETSMNVEFSPKLYYARMDRPEHRIAPDCSCRGHRLCECFIPSVTYNDSYILWMEIPDAVPALLSPPLCISAAAIIRPDSPSDVRIEITEEGKLKVLWSRPASLTHRLQYQVKYYLNATEDNSQFYLIAEEPYVTLDVPASCSPLVFEVRCRRFPSPGVWSEWSSPTVLNSQDGFYFPQKVLAGSGSNISVYCMYCNNNRKVPAKDIIWGLYSAEEIPSQQYAAISDYIAKVTITNLTATMPKGKFQFDPLYCCVPGIGCQTRYAEIYAMDVNISITCETEGNVAMMTCRWSAKQVKLLKESNIMLRYNQNINYCFETDINYKAAALKNCVLEDGFYKCVFNTIKATYSYYMWVEIQHPMGTLQSPPVCIKPINNVKPYTPLAVQAEMTVGTEHLHVTWSPPRYAVFRFRYQLRYRVQGQETEWQVLDIYNGTFANIHEVDACEPYTVQVRCRATNRPGYWSDWSQPGNTTITDVRAPLKGPEFWRIVQKNIIQKGDNITLVWQAPQREQLLCSIKGYVVLRQVSNTLIWSTYIGNTTNYTFTLQHSSVTVTVRAFNSRGHSKMNCNLTLSEKMSTVQAVRSLDVYLLNSSAVAVWKLLPVANDPLDLVLEWRNLRETAQVRWAFISPNVSKYYIEVVGLQIPTSEVQAVYILTPESLLSECRQRDERYESALTMRSFPTLQLSWTPTDQFFAIEKYQFSLTPVFPHGVCSPHITYEFSKVSGEMQNNAGFYVILPVITATSFLLAITLAITHQRMKQMFWKDVPNPKYCSWAQGVNFQKPDTLENLFMKHREHLAHSFPLILEPEDTFENMNIGKGWEKEDIDITSIPDQLTDDRDSACATSQFSSSCTYADESEVSIYKGITSPSMVKYATIVSNPQPTKQCMSGRKMSVSSCDGCFLRNTSIVIGNLDDEKQAFLIMAGLQTKQPGNKSSNSVVSSEGFSEPSDQEESFEGDILERNVYYVGLDNIQNSGQDGYFSEDPLVTYHFQENRSYQEVDFSKDKSSEFIDDDYIHRSLAKKSLLSYMPQFQIQSNSDPKMFDMCS